MMELYLRTEARPAKWDDLDTTQKEAFEVILQMIKEAVADLPRSRAHEFSDKVDWLSTSRSSRTVVLSGGRGTGKTTLLASLINATTGRNGDGRYGAVPQLVADTMAKIRGRIIWLEPMDMETVPRDSNLLASILVRIEDAIGRLGNIGRTDEGLRDTEYFPSGLVESGPDYQQAMLELQRVQTAIALAWEGNLQKRGAQIDPDAYAVELLRSENARLSVNKNLDAVLNKIAGQISWISNIRDPLFLLPIDDLDLNPIACLELLKMLRMISVPRLFALILGDIYVAEIVMNLKISGDLVQAANAGANAPELLSLGANEIAAVAGEVSANALRKLIPPNQRIRLGEMDVHEAIKFRPFGLLEGFSLYELLSQYPVALAGNMPFQDIDGTASAENRVDSLKKFLLVGQPEVFKELWNENQNAPKNESGLKEASDGQMSRPDIQKLQSDEISKSVYTGLSFLKGTPRAISDLWYAFNHLIKFKNEVFKPDNRVAGEADKPNMPPNDDVLHQKLVKVMAEHCRSLLMEERGITPTERIRFKNGIHQNNKGQWEIGQLPLSVACDTDHYMDHSQPTPLSVSTSDGFFFDPSYRFNTAGAWRFQVAGVFKGSIEETSVDKSDMEQAYQLTPGTASALKILHDLLILGPGGSNFKSTLLNREIDFLDLSCTVWHSTSMRRCELAWPEALCSSFWEYDLFLSAWNDALYKIEASHLLEFAVFVWLSLGTAIIDRIQPVQASNSSIFQYADLNGIIERLAGLPGNSQIPAVHAKEWLIRVFLLMMPECALPDAICAPFLQSDKLRLHWNAYLPSIVRKRAKRLGLFAQNDMPNLAAALIDKTPPAFNEFNPAYDQIG